MKWKWRKDKNPVTGFARLFLSFFPSFFLSFFLSFIPSCSLHFCFLFVCGPADAIAKKFALNVFARLRATAMTAPFLFVFGFFFDSVCFYCGHRISFFSASGVVAWRILSCFFLLGVVVIGRFFIGAPCGAAIFTGPMTCRFAVLPSFTGFYRVLLPFFSIFTDSYLVYRVLPSYTRFSWFLPSLPSFTEYYLVFFRSFEPILTVFGLFFTDSYLVYRVLASWHLVWLVFTQFYRVLLGFTGFYLVLLGFFLVLLGFT